MSLPSFSFDSSYDYIKLSIQQKDYQPIYDQVIRGLSFKYRDKKSKGFYKVIDTYTVLINGSSYEVKVMYPRDSYIPIGLKLRHPDEHIIQYFRYALSSSKYSVSKIEISFDFITDELAKMFMLFKKSIYLKWPGNQFAAYYDESSYYNNIRKARSKGCILYIKRQDVSSPRVRLELIFKRALLKRKKILLLTDLQKIDYSLIKKYLEFKEFDYKLLRNRFTNEYGKQDNYLAAYNMLKNRINDLIDSGKLYKANKMPSFIKNYTYLKEHPFNEVFFSLLKENSVLSN